MKYLLWTNREKSKDIIPHLKYCGRNKGFNLERRFMKTRVDV
jgi:hypothetical protein